MSEQRLFISHASEDASVADKIVAYLEASGVPCWISSRDIPPRAIYADSIAEGMQASTACVVIVSAAANASKAVKRELELASHEDKPFIPIRIDGTEPAAGLAYYLRNTQWIDYRRDGERALDRIAGPETPLTPAKAEPAEWPIRIGRAGRGRFALMLGGAFALTLILFAGVSAVLPPGQWLSPSTNLQDTNRAAWEELDRNDVNVLRAFLAGDPGGYRHEAEAALAELEQAAFSSAIEDDTLDGLERFLTDFPGSGHASQIRRRIAELADAPKNLIVGVWSGRMLCPETGGVCSPGPCPPNFDAALSFTATESGSLISSSAERIGRWAWRSEGFQLSLDRGSDNSNPSYFPHTFAVRYRQPAEPLPAGLIGASSAAHGPYCEVQLHEQ